MSLRGYALALVGIAGCARTCGTPPRDILADVRDAAVSDPRCVAEIAHGAVFVPPGLGAIDAIAPTCSHDRTLSVWVVRGHTLSRTDRSLETGRSFGVPAVIATGVAQLGPLPPTSRDGPAAWRSPTVDIDDLDRDQWWAGVVGVASDGGVTVRRGSVVMPPAAVGLGVLAPIEADGGVVAVFGSIVMPGANPALVRVGVGIDGETRSLDAGPPSIVDGELEAYESSRHTALVYRVTEAEQQLVAVVARPDGSVSVGAPTALQLHHVRVSPQGLDTLAGAVFAWTEFDVARGGADAGADCIQLDPSLCARPGPVTLGVVTDRGLRTIALRDRGLVDTMGREADGRVLVLYLAAENHTGVQRAVRVDVANGNVTPVATIASSELPPLDHPTLVACGGELWLAAEIRVSGAQGEGEDSSAVTVVPAACLGR